jgi:hypothetical protein
LKGCDATTDPANPRLVMSVEDDPSNHTFSLHNYPMVGEIVDYAPWRFLKWEVPKYRMYDAVFKTITSNPNNDNMHARDQQAETKGATGTDVQKTFFTWIDYHSLKR